MTPIYNLRPVPWLARAAASLDRAREDRKRFAALRMAEGKCRAMSGQCHDIVCGRPVVPRLSWCEDHARLYLTGSRK